MERSFAIHSPTPLSLPTSSGRRFSKYKDCGKSCKIKELLLASAASWLTQSVIMHNAIFGVMVSSLSSRVYQLLQ